MEGANASREETMRQVRVWRLPGGDQRDCPPGRVSRRAQAPMPIGMTLSATRRSFS